MTFSIIILYFFILQMVCSIAILFLEWFWLHSSSSSQIFLASLLSVLYGRLLFRKVFLTPKIPKVKHIYHLFWSCGMILLIDVIVMPFSFLVFCFMDDYTLVANHYLCLYGMPFHLSRIVHISSFFS